MGARELEAGDDLDPEKRGAGSRQCFDLRKAEIEVSRQVGFQFDCYYKSHARTISLFRIVQQDVGLHREVTDQLVVLKQTIEWVFALLRRLVAFQLGHVFGPTQAINQGFDPVVQIAGIDHAARNVLP